MVEKGGKSLAMGATALRSTAIYGTHKTTQAANTKKINHLETAEQIVDSTARAFLNQMLGAQEHMHNAFGRTTPLYIDHINKRR